MNDGYFYTLQPESMLFKKEQYNDAVSALQAQVGGYFEVARIAPSLMANDIYCYINEQGKYIDEMLPTFILWNEERNTAVDIIVGPACFLRRDIFGEVYGLTDLDIELVDQWYDSLQTVMIPLKSGGGEKAVKLIQGFRSR